MHMEHVYKDDFHTETMGGVVQLPHLLTIWPLIALWAAVANGLP